MAEILYNLLSSQAFWIAVAAWLFVCVAWADRWRPLIERLGRLVVKPVIFKPDPNPDNIPFYPRNLLEDIANGFRNTLRQPFTDLIRVVSEWFKNLSTIIYSRDHPFRTLGYLLMLTCFLLFVLADAIAVANTLVVLDLWAGFFPPLLGRFDYAVFGGSLLALIIGMALVFETRSSQSEFSQWSDRDARTKSLGLGIAFLVTLLSLITLVAWALFRLIELDRLNSTPLLDGLLNWVLFGLVPINSALAAAITFLEALRGIAVIVLLLGWIIIGALYIVNYVLTILGTITPFLLDVVYRVVYMAIDILQWLISTPIQAIILPFKWIGTMISGSPEDKSGQSRKEATKK